MIHHGFVGCMQEALQSNCFFAIVFEVLCSTVHLPLVPCLYSCVLILLLSSHLFCGINTGVCGDYFVLLNSLPFGVDDVVGCSCRGTDALGYCILGS